MAPMNTSTTAWLAGLLEGEGCFYLAHNGRRWRPNIEINMTDRDIIERVAVLFGTRVYQGSNQHPGRWKDRYRARAQGANARRIMKAVLPYMGERRSQKINELLARPFGRQ